MTSNILKFKFKRTLLPHKTTYFTYKYNVWYGTISKVKHLQRHIYSFNCIGIYIVGMGYLRTYLYIKVYNNMTEICAAMRDGEDILAWWTLVLSCIIKYSFTVAWRYIFDPKNHHLCKWGADITRLPLTKWLPFRRRHFLRWKLCIWFIFHCIKGPIDNKPMLVQVMAWCQIGAKPLSESMLIQFTDANLRQ